MAIFSSQQEAEEILGSFMDHIVADPQLRPLFVEAATSFRANYADPDVVVSMVTTVDPPMIKRGEEAKAEKVEVDMFMSADDGHTFWLGELNIPMAMARRKIKIEGPVGSCSSSCPRCSPLSGCTASSSPSRASRRRRRSEPGPGRFQPAGFRPAARPSRSSATGGTPGSRSRCAPGSGTGHHCWPSIAAGGGSGPCPRP